MTLHSLTKRQRNAFARLLCHIGSWTESRFDQHLMYDVGDDDTKEILNWLRSQGINTDAIGHKRISEPAEE